MRALVTGGCGFIGSNLVDKLIASDWDVLVIDDMSSGNVQWRNDNAKYIFTDVSLALETSKFEKIDVIFHLAAEARIQPSYEDPLRWQQSNILGTAAVCEYARKNGCKVILAGSSSCYGGKFMNPYTFSKKISEEMCEMYSKVFGVSTVTARFFNVYGPRNPMIGEFTPIIAKFEALMRKGEPLTVVGDGEQRRDFTHVFDICAGLIKLAEKPWTGEVFNLGTGVNYSINELVEMFGCEKIHLPARHGESRETKADISMTTSATGWSPQYDLEKYINNLKKT
jgi:nucleoside-diphosphate-sugar epimerase